MKNCNVMKYSELDGHQSAKIYNPDGRELTIITPLASSVSCDDTAHDKRAPKAKKQTKRASHADRA